MSVPNDPVGVPTGGLGHPPSQDFKAMREELGVSFRELVRRTGISTGTLGRIESGGKEPTLDEVVRITTALGAKLEDQPVYRQVVREHQAKPGIRRCFVCLKCRRRTYLAGEPGVFVPECRDHGPMVRQANMPYMGQSTEPPPEWGWPPAKDGTERRDEAMARAVASGGGA